MTNPWLRLAALAGIAAIASPGAAATTPATASEVVALCNSDASGCTEYVLLVEVDALINEQPPYACFMKSDYGPPHIFRAEKLAALNAWMAAHPDPAAPAKAYTHRAALSVFPETPACLAELPSANR